MKNLLMLVVFTAMSFSVSANWVYNERIDSIDDSDNSYLYTVGSKESTSAAIMCDGDVAEVVFLFSYLGDKYLDILVRFDSGEPMIVSSTASTNGRGRYVLPMYTDSIMNSMVNSKRMVVRVMDFQGTPVTSVFDLTGFNQSRSKLKCSR